MRLPPPFSSSSFQLIYLIFYLLMQNVLQTYKHKRLTTTAIATSYASAMQKSVGKSGARCAPGCFTLFVCPSFFSFLT